MSKPTYRIRDWSKHFECAQSRRNSGPMRWFSVPTSHDTRGFRRLMNLPNGVTLYGCWILIVSVAAKCTPRGVLMANDGPLDADELSLKTGAPAHTFAETLKVLSDPAGGIFWLDCDQSRSAVGVVSERAQSAVGDISEGSIRLAATYIQTDIQRKEEKPKQEEPTLSERAQSAVGDDGNKISETKRRLLQAIANRKSQEPRDTSLSAAELAANAAGGAP